MNEMTELSLADQIEIKRPKLVIRVGRGRTGGSTVLDLIIQRARYQGRRVKPLDGDLKSRTLMDLYPAEVDGRQVEDAATAPQTDQLPDVKDWLSVELDEMVKDRVSRVLDLSGGDRVMQEYVEELCLKNFSQELGIDIVLMVFLGPVVEDFRHAYKLLKTEGIPTENVVLVLNEGVIRAGQTVAGAFDSIIKSADFREITNNGARLVFLPRLTCMERLQQRNLRYFDVIAARSDALNGRLSPTLYHMVKTWVDKFEQGLIESGAAEWMP